MSKQELKEKVSKLGEKFVENIVKELKLEFSVYEMSSSGEAFSDEAQMIYNDLLDLMDRLI